MPVFYLDTSAIVKRYRLEEGTRVMDYLLEDPPGEDRFYTSFLSVLELTSGILRLAKGGKLTEDIAAQILSRFRRDMREQFRVWPLDSGIVSAAIPVVAQHRLRSGDAIHLSTAMAIFSLISSQEAVIVSSDNELVGAATSSGITALDPRDSDALERLARLRTSSR